VSNERASIDAAVIRQTYDAGLDVGGGCPPAPKEVTHLRGMLTGHVRLLIPEVTDIAARMRGEWRRTAIHVIVRAHHLVEDSAHAKAAALGCDVHDLAVVCRALLALYLHPGPLSAPTGHAHIEESVRRKVCGACSEQIVGGQQYEPAMFAAEASGGIRGYRHTGGCPRPAVDRASALGLVICSWPSSPTAEQ
jgi:hypothetical protein